MIFDIINVVVHPQVKFLNVISKNILLHEIIENVQFYSLQRNFTPFQDESLGVIVIGEYIEIDDEITVIGVDKLVKAQKVNSNKCVDEVVKHQEPTDEQLKQIQFMSLYSLT